MSACLAILFICVDRNFRYWGMKIEAKIPATGIITKTGEATPGILSKVLRLGLNPRTIAGISRFAGLPGLALSAGLTAYDLYQAYQDRKEKDGSE